MYKIFLLLLLITSLCLKLYIVFFFLLFIISSDLFFNKVAKIKFITAKGIPINIPINNKRLYQLLIDNDFSYSDITRIKLTCKNEVNIKGKYYWHKLCIRNNKIYILPFAVDNDIKNSISNYEAYIISEQLKEFFNVDSTENLNSELMKYYLLRILPIFTFIIFLISLLSLFI